MGALAASLVEQWADPRWRLNNLYRITDEKGNEVDFRMNSAQEALFSGMHYLNVILKARQLGFTTFIQLYMLDQCVFNSNVRAGVIAHNLDDAVAFFRDKVKFPYDNLPEQVRQANPATQDSARQLTFSNNSLLRVGTSLRSGTYQLLHVSEYGKLCARFPEKAQEVKTGALNTVHAGQIAFIESTAEGQEGHFYDLCQEAQAKARRGDKLTQLDFKFHFFPWWKHPAYVLSERVPIPAPVEAYFTKLRKDHGVILSDEQMAWYTKKLEQQGDDMRREHPSTADEAFEASVQGAYYASEMARAETEKRITRVPWESDIPVETWWDLGTDDCTAIWFVQRVGREIRCIDFYQNNGEGLPHYVKVLRERPYAYGKNILPHDVEVQELGSGKTRRQTLEALGLRVTVAPRQPVDDGINAARQILPRCWFDLEKCSEGVKALKAYRRDWNDKMGTWKDDPRHDWASHPADAFRTGAQGSREALPKQPPRAKPKWVV